MDKLHQYEQSSATKSTQHENLLEKLTNAVEKKLINEIRPIDGAIDKCSHPLIHSYVCVRACLCICSTLYVLPTPFTIHLVFQEHMDREQNSIGVRMVSHRLRESIFLLLFQFPENGIATCEISSGTEKQKKNNRRYISQVTKILTNRAIYRSVEFNFVLNGNAKTAKKQSAIRSFRRREPLRRMTFLL